MSVDPLIMYFIIIIIILFGTHLNSARFGCRKAITFTHPRGDTYNGKSVTSCRTPFLLSLFVIMRWKWWQWCRRLFIFIRGMKKQQTLHLEQSRDGSKTNEKKGTWKLFFCPPWVLLRLPLARLQSKLPSFRRSPRHTLSHQQDASRCCYLA